MSLLDYPVPSLIGGVSQQPDALRFDNQGKEIDNAWMTPVDGLVKRWSTAHVARPMTGAFEADPFIHTINRDAQERYIVLTSHKKVRVFGLDGTEYGVYAPGGGAADFDYLDLHAPLGNLLSDQEDFAATSWTPSSDAAVPGSTSYEDPWRSREVVTLRNNGAPVGEGYYEHSAGTFEANGTDQVFYCYFRLTGVGDTTAMRLRLDDAVSGTFAQITWDTTDDSYALAGSGVAGGVTVMDDGDWRLVWVKVTSGDGTGGTVAAGNARNARVYTGTSTASLGAAAFGATLLAGQSTPLAYVPDADQVRHLTVADYTFILNREIVTAMKADLSPEYSEHADAQYGEALFFAKSALNCCHYYLKLHTDLPATYEEDVWTRGVRTEAAAAGNNYCGLTNPHTSSIIQGLAGHLTGTAFAGTILEVDYTGAQDNGFSSSVWDGGPVLYVAGDSTEELENVEAWTDKSSSAFVAIKDHVEAITDLPLIGMHGFIVKVIGDQEFGADDYYLKFVGDDATSTALQRGYWTETLAPGIQTSIDETTMPHQLVRQQDDASGTVTGTPYQIYFEFGAATWDDRTVGDTDTNPDPTFIGNKLDDLYFHSNRLGILSGQNVILSEVGSYFNFWRTSITEGVVDSDVIDISSSTTEVVNFESAVVFEDTLLLFSDRTQFKVTGDPSLTPKTAEIRPVFNYETYSGASPIGLGRGVLMPFKAGSFSGVREVIRAGQDQFLDVEVTAQCPAYISGDIKRIVGTSLENTAVVLADGDKSALYAYKWVWGGNEKIQSAWSRWTFGNDAEILDISFIESTLYMVVQRAAGVFIETMECSTDVKDSDLGWHARVDRRVREADCTTVYALANDETTITLPYALDDATITNESGKDQMVAVSLATGEVLTFKSITPASDQVVVEGNYDLGSAGDDFLIGFEYEFKFTFGRVMLREQRQQGAVARRVRNLITRGWLDVADTAFFTVEVTPRDGATIVHEFTPELGYLEIGNVALVDDEFQFDVGAVSEKVTLEIKSSSPLPCRFLSASWEIQASSQSTRVSG